MGPISVVIVNFQSEKKILNFLSEIISNPLVGKIWIINNSLPSPEFGNFSNVSKKVSTIQNDKNIGFAAGANIGIRKSLDLGSEKILLLNPDLKITYKDVASLFESGSEIAGPVLSFKRNGKRIYDFGGKINWFLGRAHHLESSSPPPDHTKKTLEIDYVSGACVMISRDVFEKIGFFDEKFFMYFEDVDFCTRAKRNGFKISIDQEIIIEHDLDEHRSSQNMKKIMFSLQSNLLFFNTLSLKKLSPIRFLYFIFVFGKTILNYLFSRIYIYIS